MRWLRRVGFTFVVLLLVALLVTPLLLRSHAGAPITPGAESYSHLMEAEQVASGSHSGFVISPYRLLLGFMILLGTPWLLPVLLSIALFVLLYLYLRRFTRHQTVSLLTLVILAVTPTMSVLGTHHVPQLLGFVFLVLALLLDDDHPMLAAVLVVLGAITAPVTGAFVVLFLLFSAYRGGDTTRLGSYVVAVLVSALWFYAWANVIPTLEYTLDVLTENPLFEFGNPAGVSVFLVIMAAYGCLTERVQKLGLVPFVIFLAVLATIVHQLIPLATFVFSVSAAYGIVFLVRNKWDLELLRRTLHVLIFCLGLFLLIVTVRDRIDDQPTHELSSSLVYLRNQHRPGNVLTLPEYAPMVEYFSGHGATLPPDAGTGVFLNRDAGALYDFLERTGTSHVIITEGMVDTLFTRSDEGMLFLLPNAHRFVLVYETSESKLWYYIPRR